MNSVNINTPEEYLIHLVGCGIKKIKPQENINRFDWSQLLSMSKFHGVANIVCYSIEKLDKKPPEDLMNKWKEIKNVEILKDIKQRVEIENINEMFEKNKIRAMILKGAITKYFYPQTDMRVMSDIDIQIDEENADKVKNLMTELGYVCSEYESSHHDTYNKPYVSIEIHRSMMPYTEKKLQKYYQDVFKKSVNYENYKYIYKMNMEEYYIFFIAHFYKHYYSGGSGIRYIADTYFINQHDIDYKYVKKVLCELGMYEFERDIYKLSQIWFEGLQSNTHFDDMTRYIMSSGAYGTMQNKINNDMKRNGKMGLIIRSIFVPYMSMCGKYPVLRKMPFLLPVMWIYRVFYLIFTRNRGIGYITKALFKEKDRSI